MAEKKKQPAITGRAFTQFLRAFGRAPKIVDLPRLYMELYDTFTDDTPPPENLYQRLQASLRAMELEVEGEPSINALDDRGRQILTLARNASNLRGNGWRRMVEAYSELLRTLVADKDLFWAPRALAGQDGVRWIQLRNASPKQRVVEQIRRDDPVLFERLQQSKQQRRQLDSKITEAIEDRDLVKGRQRIRGRFMLVGVDAAQVPSTVEVRESFTRKGEKQYRTYKLSRAEVLNNLDDPNVVAALPDEAVEVFDDDGSVLSRRDFSAKVDAENEAVKGLTKVNALVRRKGRGAEGFAYVDPASLASMSPEDFSAVFGPDPKPDEYVSLTDDPYKSTALTKIYPVKEYRGKQVIVAGRFKGYYVSDLVNRAGRLIEGSVTYYNPDTGELDRREVTNDDGSVNVRRITEPYVTVDRGRLMLTLGRTRGDKQATLVRNAVRNLTKLVPTIEYEEGSGNSVYRFEPKDFASIRDAIGAMALSNAASAMIRKYFDKLMRAEKAKDERNLRRYSDEKLGLKPGIKLRTQQVQAVAWLDANDNSGICALDTGVGKTGVAVATMQNLRAKGESAGGNGRFLFVCKRALAGNIAKEVAKFLPPDVAELYVGNGKRGAGATKGILDVITYREFKKNIIGTDKNPYNPPRPVYDDYTAIFFDEAHERFKKRQSVFYKAAAACKAKKVLLTASPMVRSPKEVFTLASLANGVDLNTKEGRRAERMFTNRFAEKVGGRVIGIKRADTSRGTYRLYVRKMNMLGQEPVPYEEWPGEVDVAASRDFNTWVKTNLFHADKRDVVDNSKDAYKKWAAKERKAGRDPVPYREWPGTKLEELNKVPPVAVTMPPEIEAVYRKTMNDVVKALKEVVQKTSKQYKGQQELEGADFRALAVEAAKVKLRKPLSLLTRLSDVPNLVIPGAPNPKVEQATNLIKEISGRTVLFTDSPAMAEVNFNRMVEEFPGKGHAVAYSDKIIAKFAVGKPVQFGARRYPDVNRPQKKGAGYVMDVKGGKVSVYKNDNPNRVGYALAAKDAWKVVILQYIQSRPVVTLTLTGTYAVGQNLQKFTNVIHLDRDDWSNETMKQRSARAWRAGQSEVVNEYTLDMVYGDAVTNDDADKTLDEIREIIQNMDGDLFNEVVIDSQVERIGEEWAEIKKQRSLLHQIDRRMMERALSPYASHLGKQEE